MKCSSGHEMEKVNDLDNPGDSYWECWECVEAACEKCGEFHPKRKELNIVVVME